MPFAIEDLLVFPRNIGTIWSFQTEPNPALPGGFVLFVLACPETRGIFRTKWYFNKWALSTFGREKPESFWDVAGVY